MKYDAIVIGSGQGGNPLVTSLAELGWRVALVEQKFLGGTCINTGCTPTKTMVARAQVAYYARHAARWGVNASNVSVDLSKVLAQKGGVVLSARNGWEKRFASRPNIRLYRTHGRFIGPHQVQVDDETIESDKIFIDTGARPTVPPITGIDSVGYLTNESIMELTEVPPHLLVLGGSYIGLEFAQMFRRFGSHVTVVQAVSQIVPREDPEVAAELQRALEAEAIEFLLDAKTTRAQRSGNSITLTVQRKDSVTTVTGSHLLVATGRRPNTDELSLDAAGIAVDPQGHIKVNGKLETNVPGVWALGDVKGGPAFTHISYNDYQIIYQNLIEGKNLTIDHRIVPYCLFTDPELGSAGLTEKEARTLGYKLKIGVAKMTSVSRAIERDETFGLMKLVVDAANDQILGVRVLSSTGGETVHIPYTLMLARAPYTLLKGAVYIHPTMAEGLFFVMDRVKPVD